MRRALIVVLAALLGIATAHADEPKPVDLHVILPLSGNGAFAGQTQQAVLQALSGKVNEEGGINGRPVRFVFHDDQSSPQTAVLLANDVIATSHPPVILGSALVAMCNAMAPLMAKSGPLLYCMSPGYHPPPDSYALTVGASTTDTMRTLLRYFRDQGWTKLAMISSTDATGQDADRAMAEVLGENPDMHLVAQTHFNLTDVSVAAQIERSKEAGPDVFVAWSTGTALATILKAITQSGFDVPVATTAGNFVYAQMTRFAGIIPRRFFIGSALFPAHPGIAVDPRVEAAQQAAYKVLAGVHLLPDNMSGTSWDAAMIVIDALRHLGADAQPAQLRAFITGLTDYAGIDGLYDFHRTPDRGVGQADTVVVRWDAPSGRFVWASVPGGAKLPH